MSSKENSQKEITYPDGSTKVVSFDEFMNIKAIRVADRARNIILHHEYACDGQGNIISKKTTTGAYEYNYDELSRLTEVFKDGRFMERYIYGSSGNRLSSLNTDGWEYGADNELLRYGATTFAYDSRGNTVRAAGPGGVQNYIFDNADRLIEFRDGADALKARYGYDERGRRIRKEVFKNPSPSPLIEPVEMSAQCITSTITNYVYSEDGALIGEYNLDGTAITTWFHDPYSDIPAEPLFMVHRCNKYVFHNDHLGTPQKITDAEGKVVWSATYDTFGNAEIDPDSTITSNLRFPGQYFDSETGLHYNIHRYYNPQTGRYLSKDPLKVAAEGSNLYSYANSNPLKFCDPLGLYSWYGHHVIFEKMFPRLRFSLMEALKEASNKVDENQLKRDSFMHAQLPPDETIYGGIQLIKGFISKNLDGINNLKTEKEFRSLGSALHTIQDSSCPQHAKQLGMPVIYLRGLLDISSEIILYDTFCNRICTLNMYEQPDMHVLFEPTENRYLALPGHLITEQFEDYEAGFKRCLDIIDNLKYAWNLPALFLVQDLMRLTSASNPTDNEYTVENEDDARARREKAERDEGFRRAGQP